MPFLRLSLCPVNSIDCLLTGCIHYLAEGGWVNWTV